MHLVTPDPALVMMTIIMTTIMTIMITTIMTTIMNIIMTIMMVTVRRCTWLRQTQYLAVMAMGSFKLRHL